MVGWTLSFFGAAQSYLTFSFRLLVLDGPGLGSDSMLAVKMKVWKFCVGGMGWDSSWFCARWAWDWGDCGVTAWWGSRGLDGSDGRARLRPRWSKSYLIDEIVSWILSGIAPISITGDLLLFFVGDRSSVRS